jgi:hypothetical protein
LRTSWEYLGTIVGGRQDASSSMQKGIDNVALKRLAIQGI